MSISITPHSIDTQTKVSVLDTVKGTVSSMAGKLRDIFNTMIPGRTGSWTPSSSGSPRSSFASSISGSFSTRSSIVSIESDKPAHLRLVRHDTGLDKASEPTSWLYSNEGRRHVAEAPFDEQDSSNRTSISSDTSGLSAFDFLDSMSDRSDA